MYLTLSVPDEFIQPGVLTNLQAVAIVAATSDTCSETIYDVILCAPVGIRACQACAAGTGIADHMVTAHRDTLGIGVVNAAADTTAEPEYTAYPVAANAAAWIVLRVMPWAAPFPLLSAEGSTPLTVLSRT